MRNNLAMFKKHQVFLNYPFDIEFEDLSYAMHFAVVAAGLIPVCARDLTLPDRPRVDTLVRAIANCQYSAHDLSRGTGEGDNNYARLNMSIELGMALFHDLYSQGHSHRSAFFVASQNEYKTYASDLAGLDAQYHDNDSSILVAKVYDWLRVVVPGYLLGKPATAVIQQKYLEFKNELATINGSGKNGQPTHAEAQELMYLICSTEGWWVWRESPIGQEEFPPLPLSRKG